MRRFSRLFVDALKSVVSYGTRDKLECGTLHFDEPFALIGHHLEALENYARRTDDRTADSDALTGGPDQEFVADAATKSEASSVERDTRMHVGLVLDFVNPILKDAIAEEVARYSRADPGPTRTYRMLWYLFRPEDIVYVRSDEGEDAYMVDSVDMDGFSLSSMEITVPRRINLWQYEFNGVSIARARRKVIIKPFHGERLIPSLNVVPCEIWDRIDGGRLRAALEERGKKWVDHLLGKHVDYRGEPPTRWKKSVHGLYSLRFFFSLPFSPSPSQTFCSLIPPAVPRYPVLVCVSALLTS